MTVALVATVLAGLAQIAIPMLIGRAVDQAVRQADGTLSGASVGIGNVTFVPEPGTGLLVSLGLTGIALSARRLRAAPRSLG